MNRLAPTAELRPGDQDQSDEDDLMPYDVLDAIEHAAIGQKRSPAEALPHCSPDFHSTVVTTLSGWVERFFTLWCRNQWKRERYAPASTSMTRTLTPRHGAGFPCSRVVSAASWVKWGQENIANRVCYKE